MSQFQTVEFDNSDTKQRDIRVLPTAEPTTDAPISRFVVLESLLNRAYLPLFHLSRFRTVSITAILLALVVFVQVAEAQQVTFPERPPAGIFYVDEAGLISARDRDAINALATELWDEEQIPIFAVTIRSLADHNATGYTIEQYAFELFNQWGIGTQARNYGMLLLVSEGDRQARIELGAAWGGSYDAEAQKIMDRLIIPAFKQERFSEGILFGMRGLGTMARLEAPPARLLTTLEKVLILAFLFFSFAVIISLFQKGRNGWGWALIAVVGAVILFLLKVVSILAIFGGGSGGGGGASGDW